METRKVRPYLVGFVLALWLPTTALATVEYDKHVDFSKYKTFAWMKGTPASDPLMQKQIEHAIERVLEAKGLTKTDGPANLYVVIHVLSKKTRLVDVNNLGYSGYLWRRRGARYPPTTRLYYIPVATVMVDLLDRGSKKRLWRGVTAQFLRGDPQKVATRIDKATKKMFKKFPPKKQLRLNKAVGGLSFSGRAGRDSDVGTSAIS